AEAGAAARPFANTVARGPGASGTPAAPAGLQSFTEAGADGGGGATPAASRFPAPAAGRRSTRTGPDHSPFSYGIPKRPASCHHRSITRGSPSTGPPPRPMSRLYAIAE